MFAGNAWIWLKSLFDAKAAHPAGVAIGQSSEIPPGGVKLFTYPTERDTAILVRKADGALVAYSQKCTHLSCAVYYSKERNRLECPCHEGYFSIDTGRVLQGPPPRPLPKILLTEKDGQVFAVGIDAQAEGS
jgi:Rieske Fe-S protein